VGFELSLLYLIKIYLIIRRNQWCIIINAHRSVGLGVKFRVFNENTIVSIDFQKSNNRISKFNENLSIACWDVSCCCTNMHVCTHTHTHTYIQHTCMSQRQQDVEQVTSTQIHTTLTKQTTTNPVQINKIPITFTYKQFICTPTAVCSLVFACGCSN
jgi:hypothetical protein